MSDAIREAFELHFAAYHGGNNMTFDHSNNYYLCQEVNYYWLAFQAGQEAALQQTAPAVPEGWIIDKVANGHIRVTSPCGESALVSEPYEPEEMGVHSYVLLRLAETLLTAAPQPDHSPDAGKVVQGEPVGWVVEREGDSTFPLFYFDRAHAENMVREVELLPFATMHPVYTHPAESREEIQAQALEAYADQLDVVFANAQRAGANDCPAWHAGQFAKDARKQAARLRASQQEGNTAGDDGEGE